LLWREVKDLKIETCNSLIYNNLFSSEVKLTYTNPPSQRFTYTAVKHLLRATRGDAGILQYIVIRLPGALSGAAP
jgi:hypothetical protein